MKDHKAMVAALKRGDKIVTTGGIVGTVERVMDDDKAEILIAENVTIEIVRSSGVQSLVTDTKQKK